MGLETLQHFNHQCSHAGECQSRVNGQQDGSLILIASVLKGAGCFTASSSIFPTPLSSPMFLPVPSSPILQCSPVHPGRQEHRGWPEAWIWQLPILEQKEEQGSLSRAWHLWPVKPEGQVQEKLGAKGEGRLGEPGRVGSRAWQLPPFWQSWASWQGSGNWHVSPRKPGAHLGRGGKGKTQVTGFSLPSFPPPSFAFIGLHLLPSSSFPSPSSSLPSLPLSGLPFPGGTLTGSSLVPERGSGRCLRWHRVLGSPHTAALGMDEDGKGMGTVAPPGFPSGCSRGPCLQQPHKCSPPPRLLSLVPTHMVLLPQHLPPHPQGLWILSAPNPHPLSCLFSSLPSPASSSIPGKLTTGLRRGAQGTPGR